MASEAGFTKAEKDRLKAILSDTITMLCRNGLNAKFEREFTVEGLIGITVDSSELLLVSIKDIIKNPNAPTEESEDETSDGAAHLSNNKKRRKRRKSQADDYGSEPKTPRTDSEYEGNYSTTPMRRNFNLDDTRTSLGGQSNDNLLIQEMKQDNGDEDLVEIIKEEPGMSGTEDGSHIVSIQSLSQTQPPFPSHLPPTPHMLHPGAPLPPGATSLPPVSMGDLNEQVELMPGSGVFIKRATYNQLQFIDKGSKLVRKLVREIFPDVHLLASSSCMGKGETSAGLDRHKVEVIKGCAEVRFGWNRTHTNSQWANIVADMRYQLRKRGRPIPPSTSTP